MAGFRDAMLFKLLDDPFVDVLLTDDVDLLQIYGHSYDASAGTAHAATLASFERRFSQPRCETLVTTGTEETTPRTSRTTIRHQRLRGGRTIWVDCWLDLLTDITFEGAQSPLQEVAAKNLLDEVGPVNTIEQLRSALAARWSDGLANAFLEQMRFQSIEAFRRSGTVALEFTAEPLPPFDPADPANVQRFPIALCLLIVETLDVSAALQRAMETRSVLEQERTFRPTVNDVEVRRPYALVVAFPDALVADDLVPNTTAAAFRQATRDLFAHEEMTAAFIPE